MTPIGKILLAGFSGGFLTAAIAFLLGASWGWVALAYVIGGDVFLVMTAMLFMNGSTLHDRTVLNRD